MTLFRDLSIGLKIGSGFFFVILLILINGLFTYQNFNKLNKYQGEIADLMDTLSKTDKDRNISTELMVLTQKWFTPVVDEGAALSQYILFYLAEDEENIQKAQKRLALQNKKIDLIGKEISTKTKSSNGKRQIEFILKKEKEVFNQAVEVIMAIDNEGEYNSVVFNAEKKFYKQLTELEAALNKFRKLVEEEAKFQKIKAIEASENINKKVLDSLSATASTKALTVSMVMVIAVLSFISAVLITRSITSPTSRVVNMIEALSQGDIEDRLNMGRKDEIGQLANALDDFADLLKFEILGSFEKLSDGNFTSEAKGIIREPLRKTNESLSKLINQINIIGEHIADASSTVSSNSQNLSQGATEQASSLEEITSSMTEIGEQTKLNSESSDHANILATKACKSAEDGNERVKEMVGAMAEINTSGKNISKIIKVIDEIAFQTNLLALNAAVEAARAGVHGKGFAIVAQEVRNLAVRSANAAQETEALIEGAVKKTEKGSQIADETSKSLDEVVAGINKVKSIMQEIAVASKEQFLGISQVNEGLSQIDKVTQLNAANAEMGASSSVELAGHAEKFKHMLKRFQLLDQATETDVESLFTDDITSKNLTQKIQFKSITA